MFFLNKDVIQRSRAKGSSGFSLFYWSIPVLTHSAFPSLLCAPAILNFLKLVATRWEFITRFSRLSVPALHLHLSAAQEFYLRGTNFPVPPRKQRGRGGERGEGNWVVPTGALSACASPLPDRFCCPPGRAGRRFGRRTEYGCRAGSYGSPFAIGRAAEAALCPCCYGPLPGSFPEQDRTGADTRAPRWPPRRLCDLLAGGMWRVRRAAVAW